MEEICGEVVRTHFEDTDCGPDPMPLSDIEYNSVEDDVRSDDDEIHKKVPR